MDNDLTDQSKTEFSQYRNGLTYLIIRPPQGAAEGDQIHTNRLTGGSKLSKVLVAAQVPTPSGIESGISWDSNKPVLTLGERKPAIILVIGTDQKPTEKASNYT